MGSGGALVQGNVCPGVGVRLADKQVSIGAVVVHSCDEVGAAIVSLRCTFQLGRSHIIQ